MLWLKIALFGSILAYCAGYLNYTLKKQRRTFEELRIEPVDPIARIDEFNETLEQQRQYLNQIIGYQHQVVGVPNDENPFEGVERIDTQTEFVSGGEFSMESIPSSGFIVSDTDLRYIPLHEKIVKETKKILTTINPEYFDESV